MNKKTLAIANLALSAVIGIHEAVASGSVIKAETFTNEATGQVLTRHHKRGINPVMALAALAGGMVGYSGLEDDEMVVEEFENNSAEENTQPRQITQISYALPQKKRVRQKDNRSIVEAIADYGKSVLLAAVTGSGKTTLLNNTINKVIQQEGEHVNFLVIDPKSSKWKISNDRFEDGESSILYVKQNNAQQLLDRLKWVADEYLEARQKARLEADNYNPPKTIIIIDEFLALQTKVKRALGSAAIQEINELVAEIIVMGREDKVTVWLVAQTHQCTKIGMSDGIRANVGVVGLASPDNTDSVEAMAKDHYLFKSDGDRQKISQAIEKFKGSYFYVSNLKTDIEIAPTPKPKNKLSKASDPWQAAA